MLRPPACLSLVTNPHPPVFDDYSDYGLRFLCLICLLESLRDNQFQIGDGKPRFVRKIEGNTWFRVMQTTLILSCKWSKAANDENDEEDSSIIFIIFIENQNNVTWQCFAVIIEQCGTHKSGG